MEDMQTASSVEDEQLYVSEETKKFSLGAIGEIDKDNVNSEENSDNRISAPIERAVTASVVKNVNMDSVDKLEADKAYMIDFSENVNAIVPAWMKGLKNLIISSKEGVVDERLAQVNAERKRQGLYELRPDAELLIKTMSGTRVVGYVDSLMVHKVLRNLVKVSFDSKVKLYVKVEGDDKARFKEWRVEDVRGVRLRL